MKEQNLDLPEFDEEKHWLSWTDMIDREYRAGDIVAYAATVGRSAGLTVGMVRRINRLDSTGELVTKRKYNYDTREYEFEDSCTVRIAPLVDSANRFERWTARDVTIGPDKIIRLDLSIGDVVGVGAYNG